MRFFIIILSLVVLFLSCLSFFNLDLAESAYQVVLGCLGILAGWAFVFVVDMIRKILS